MLPCARQSIGRIQLRTPPSTHGAPTCASKKLKSAAIAKQSSRLLFSATTRTTFLHRITPSSLSFRPSISLYHSSIHQGARQPSAQPSELASQCAQVCEERSASLRSTETDYAVELDKLREVIATYSDKTLEPHVSRLLRLWLSSETEIPASYRITVLELAAVYYSNLQLLINLETIVFSTRKTHQLVPSLETYVTLLTLSGRHKQLPSIEMAFKFWKKDYGLTYEVDPTVLQDAVLDYDALLATAAPTPSSPSRRAGAAFFEYVKGSKQEDDVICLFSTTMRAAARSKNLDFVESVFQEALMVIKNNQPLYDTMADIYCAANRVEKAHKLLFLMDKKDESLLVVLGACARLKNYHLAEKVFYDSQAAFGLVPTIDRWNALLEVYIIREEMSVAHERFIDMLRSKHGIRPNIQTYEQMVTGHVRAKDTPRVEEMFKHALSNNVDISTNLYAWVMEAYVHAKDHDKAFGIVQTMHERGLVLPQKFKNLLLQRCRRVDGLLERYERYFGTAPEPFDDLKEVRAHAEAKRASEKQMAEDAKTRKKNAKRAEAAPEPLASTSLETNNLGAQQEAGEIAEKPQEEVLEEDDNTQFVDVVEGSPGNEFGFLEEIVEDDVEVSMEEWMKDDMGEQGWMDFSKPDGGSSRKYKRSHNLSMRYRDVFEVAGWNDPLDVQGKVKPKEWQILSDPFSKTRPEVADKKREMRRVSSQIETLQQEVVDKIEAETERNKLRQQRRRERAYGQTRRYTDDPKKLRKDKEQKDFRKGPPAGSTFTFR